MEILYIGICDDNLDELEKAGRMLSNYANQYPGHNFEVKTFSAPMELLESIEEKGGFDILLLDVYMPGILGTEAARELRNTGDDCQIIFLTTSRDHAVDAFSLNAAHYLVKPYSEKEFETALDKAIENLTKNDGVYITVKSTDGISRIALKKLVYSETDNHVQCLHLSDGRTIYVRKSSTELFELLAEEPRFYKCGSTYIVNMDYIVQLSSKKVVFSDGDEIPILSRKFAEFKKLYMDYSCSR